MEIPLKLKWLGRETGEIYSLIAPFHPLILIDPAPQLRNSEIPPGLIALPRRVYKVWDLRKTEKTNSGRPTISEIDLAADLKFDVLKWRSDAPGLSAVYQFYFDLYLKSSALENLPRTAAYQYLERLHSTLLERNFIAMIRVLRGEQALGGLLLRHPSAIELACYQQRLQTFKTITRKDVAIIDLVEADAQLDPVRLKRALVRRAAQWVQAAGYSFLSSAAATYPVLSKNECDEDWTLSGEATPVWNEDTTALLYCDFSRCCYLSKDVHYYSANGKRPCLHYIVNIDPTRSWAMRLLNTLVHIEKRVYTRQPRFHELLSAAGIECEFLAPPRGAKANMNVSRRSLAI